MMMFAKGSGREPAGLILTAAEAARQHAVRRAKMRLIRDAADRLRATGRRPIGDKT